MDDLARILTGANTCSGIRELRGVAWPAALNLDWSPVDSLKFNAVVLPQRRYLLQRVTLGAGAKEKNTTTLRGTIPL